MNKEQQTRYLHLQKEQFNLHIEGKELRKSKLIELENLRMLHAKWVMN